MDRPSLAEVLVEALDSRAAQIRTALPARVVRYYQASQEADVQPLVSPDGIDQPIIPLVPVCHLRASADASYLALPVSHGDTGLLICCEADIREWRRTGEAGTAPDAARHHLHSAVFLPCLTPTASVLTHPAGSTVLAATDLRLGSATAWGANAFLLRSAINTDLGTLLTTLNAWGAAVDALAGPTGLWPAVAAAIGTLQAGIAGGTYQTTNTKAD
jgi:hypothetical protein